MIKKKEKTKNKGLIGRAGNEQRKNRAEKKNFVDEKIEETSFRAQDSTAIVFANLTNSGIKFFYLIEIMFLIKMAGKQRKNE